MMDKIIFLKSNKRSQNIYRYMTRLNSKNIYCFVEKSEEQKLRKKDVISIESFSFKS